MKNKNVLFAVLDRNRRFKRLPSAESRIDHQND